MQKSLNDNRQRRTKKYAGSYTQVFFTSMKYLTIDNIATNIYFPLYDK